MSPSWRISEEAAGERLDRYLARHLSTPRNQIQRWIREGGVIVDGDPAKASTQLSGNEWLEVSPPEREDGQGLEPAAGEGDLLQVLYEDPDLVVVDKPAGIAVHPGAGRRRGTLAHQLVDRYPEMRLVGSPMRPGIVHRLDLGTTGALVVARSELAYRELSAAFAERRVEKIYLAVVYGSPPAIGTIDRPIGRHRTLRKQMTVRRDGREAHTEYRVLSRIENQVALLEVRIATGRTHQIRVHLKSIGHPLVGDPTYAGARWRSALPRLRPVLRELTRPALHAWRLVFAHPRHGGQVSLTCPPAADLRTLWSALGGEDPREWLEEHPA